MALLTLTQDFVLLDHARESGAGPARLYTNPVEIVRVDDPTDLASGLDRLRGAQAQGLHAAGWLAYEAGHLLEPRLRSMGGERQVYALFGLFQTCRILRPGDVPNLLPDGVGGWAAMPRPMLTRSRHAALVARAKTLIAAGDIYQVNLTFPAEVLVAGSPLALYARLRAGARAGWGGIVNLGGELILSFSPELFFTLDQGALTARPMKGTASADTDPQVLAADPKQRAENLMIVDLLRNDLARVAEPGSVAVPELFTVETYPTVHQLTSTIGARLREGLGPVDIIEAMFPCGSVTGAPKVRAMEVIGELEDSPRGIYTGSIGWIDPAGDAAFNVAIRTLRIDPRGGRAIMGLGSGIVADSEQADEWRECLAKGAFVTAAMRPFDLIETMRFDPIDGIAELDRHLARMKESAGVLGFSFDRHDARNELQAATFRLRASSRLRLLLSPSGAIAIETRALPVAAAAPVEVALRPRPVPADDFRLHHKTSDRGFYDEARRGSGCFEVAFVDEQGFLTEGSFTNLFVKRDGRLLTPPLSRGLLPGVLRAHLLTDGQATEADLTPEDLAAGFFVGNMLRGLIPARLVAGAASAGL